jgi:hypothetical protein
VVALSTWLLMPLPEWVPMINGKKGETDFLTFADSGLG